MKGSSPGSSRSKHSTSPRKNDSFSSTAMSQLELLHSPVLGKSKPMKTQIRNCAVSIEGSKCNICKKVFKCKPDVEKHMKKTHKYLLSKKDNKLVRLVMKFGKKKFRNSKVQKYMMMSSTSTSVKMVKTKKNSKNSRTVMYINDIEVDLGENYAPLSPDVSKVNEEDDGEVKEVLQNDFESVRRRTDQNGDGEVPSDIGVIIQADGKVLEPEWEPTETEPIAQLSNAHVPTRHVLGNDFESDRRTERSGGSPISEVNEEDDSDDREVVFENEVLQNDFESVRRRTERTGDGEVPSDIGSSPGSPRSKHSTSPRKNDSFSFTAMSQLELLHSPVLRKSKPMKTQIRNCAVSIEGSKCNICKKVFKCKPDVEKHMKKTHKYLLSKKDNKLVRLVMKFGKKKFRNSKAQKYMMMSSTPTSVKMVKTKKISKDSRTVMYINDIEVDLGENYAPLSLDVSKVNEEDDGEVKEVLQNDFESIRRRTDQNGDGEVPSDIGVIIQADGKVLEPEWEPTETEPIAQLSNAHAPTRHVLGNDFESDRRTERSGGSPISEVNEEDDSDDREVVFENEVLQNDFESVRRRTERTGDGEVPSDIGFIIQADGKVLEPEWEPMETEPIAHAPNAYVPEVPDDADEDVFSVSDSLEGDDSGYESPGKISLLTMMNPLW